MPRRLNRVLVGVALVLVFLVSVLQLSFTAQPALAASHTRPSVQIHEKLSTRKILAQHLQTFHGIPSISGHKVTLIVTM
jgi:hypothetical protein